MLPCLLNSRSKPQSRQTSSIRRQIGFLENLERREVFASGFLTSALPYLIPSAPAVEITPILTVGDSVPETSPTAAGEQYRMVGIPDGMGAYDNGDGTFTVLMNHELGASVGTVREHGAKGSFVSKWVIDKTTLEVLSGDDLIQQIQVWVPSTPTTPGHYVTGTVALARLCSADLPSASAFFNPATGLGTPERIFMNGEESTGGRAFGTVVSTGIAYELPALGKFAFENSVASPFAQNKTIVVGLDDSNRAFSSEGATDPSEVYVYVGNKTNVGTPIEKAGLTNGILHGLRVGTPGNYDATEASVTNGERFELVSLGNVSDKSASSLQADSITQTITQFRRVEDGAFDPLRPNVFYFVTTDRFDSIQDPGSASFPNTPASQNGLSRLWRLTFDNIKNPELGGRIELVIDGTGPEQMLDNLTTNFQGNVLLQEDAGNQAYLGKIRQFNTTTKDLIEVARHNPSLFDPNVATTSSLLTRDEEASGIVDVSKILGPGFYIANVQAHYPINAANPRGFTNPDELVEGGQLVVINTNAITATLSAGVLTVQGSINNDSLSVSRRGSSLLVHANGKQIGEFPQNEVDTIVAKGEAGNDTIIISRGINHPSLLFGGLGDDRLSVSSSPSIMIGGAGRDYLDATSNGAVMIGNESSLTVADLLLALDEWTSPRTYSQRVASMRAWINASTTSEDNATDLLFGGRNLDWFFPTAGDRVLGFQRGELVN
ncbi:MAG: hypothetical protein U1A77_00905 [Pirellulales bacterium]